MALFVDGPVNSVEELTHEDSGLLDTAAVCGINVSRKLRLAWEEMRSDLALWLDRPRPVLEMAWQPALSLNQIVVSEPLRRWERMSALASVYRDAYFGQLVDRYQAKWDEYSKLMRNAREILIATGLDLVSDPILRAAIPALSVIAGAGPSGTFYASVAWTNAAGEEGQASDASSIATLQGQLMTVTAVNAPANVTGFNVYAGLSPDSMTLQNTAPLAPGGLYTYIPGAISAGRLPSCGQRAQFRRPLARTLLRG